LPVLTPIRLPLVRRLSIAAILLISARAQTSSPDPERGRQIYRTGVGVSGKEITAVFGKNGPEVSASTTPCATCHGRDGRGKPEGGVTPSDIRWRQLTRDIPAGGNGGRVRPGYTERLLVRAFTMGLDSGGKPLNPVMPLYRMPASDARDLAAFIAMLGSQPDPGVSDTSLRLGALLPPHNQGAPELSRSIREVLTAYFADAAKDPVFGRVIEMRYLELPEVPEDRAAAVRTFLREQGIFALVTGFLAGSDKEIGKVLDELGVPLVNAISASPPLETNRYAFYLDGGIASQANALVNSVLENGASAPIAILYSPGGVEQQAADNARALLSESEWPEVHAISTRDSDWMAQIARSNAKIVLLLSRFPSFQPLAKLPDTLFLVPGVLLPPDSTEIPRAAGTRIRAAFPVLPSDFDVRAVAEYQKLAERYHLPAAGVQAQRSALCGAKIVMELLNRSGREVSREGLVDQQENLREFPTGWSPVLSYSPGNHIGIREPHVFELGKNQ